jgi:hypothetical protein
MSLTVISSNVAGYTKKQLTAAVVFVGFCIGNAVGPQTFISSQARTFLSSDHCPSLEFSLFPFQALSHNQFLQEQNTITDNSKPNTIQPIFQC